MPTLPTAERSSRPAIRIRAIVAVPLFGDSPKGGWSAEIKPEDSIHALVAVHTDAGITGYGSVFTDGRLVQAALQVLEPLFWVKTPSSPNASLKNCTKTPSGWVAAAA
jgi:D-galactarolactone cycloisomerase